MIEDLKPYPEYKDSGLPWLGEIPGHWGLRRTKYLFSERVQKGFPKEPLLAATQTQGVILKTNYGSRTVEAMKDFHLLKLVEPGDFVISLRSFEGGIEVAHSRGIISPAYTILKPETDSSHNYFEHFFKSSPFISSLTLFVTGIREGQNIDYERMSRALLPIPPAEDQEAIGQFLRQINRRIDHYIRAKKKLIALLNEQKQAIIHRAVTRGLDPNVQLKPSGIAWLGDIPEHWDTRKMKFLVTTYGGMTPSKAEGEFWNGNIPWVSPKDMKVVEIAGSQDHISESALAKTSIALIRPPAVLIVVRGMILARTFPVAVTTAPVTLNQDMKALLPIPELNGVFLVRLLTGIRKDILDLVEESGHGTRCLRTESLQGFVLPLPPLADQIVIVDYLKSALAGADETIARTQQEIDLIREYRTRLIADVVTGKLDVREAAAKLPEETDSPEELEANLSPDEDIEEAETTDAPSGAMALK